ncbi:MULTISPECIES: DNA cytosine methyltransferase [Paenibacillus]|uniref:Cytosine-specific methyltransferase n=1 Tax=Paenibacillus pabuli TaxID=1472 RepID=A0A855XT63_9BACL|nr:MULTISPECIES: DNA cytosine methyltransferase [Paenibacillus]PWW37360.1 DNA (cytosine-5)-methyltransferase 1 [Paenibacillus pabuli]PXW05502.1 DNA (cytosine-5)-methyltransferase 1 [Paenibacillus taichungensis]
MIKILELFGGIGAPRKALINLGIEHKAIDYVEIDEKAVRSYNAMYDRLHKPQSVVGWNLCPDILVHGSPCQDFSRSGKRLGGKDEDKTRSSLMWETLRIIENMGSWKPKVVVWENVKGVRDKDMIHSFNKYLNRMNELGYTNSFEVLNAMDFGIPQGRERVITISMLDGSTFDFGQLKKRPMRHIEEFLESNVTGEQYQINIPSMLSRIEEFNPGVRGKYRPLDVIEDRCWTISTRQDRCPNAGIIRQDNGTYRYLTERECWRLMGFSDDDFDQAAAEFPTTPGKRNATLYKLAGNSIVVQVLEAIFEAVLMPGEQENEFISTTEGQLQLII